MQLTTYRLGIVEYDTATALQRHLRVARQSDQISDALLLLEHPPVYTRGRRSQANELPMSEAWYRERGIDIVDTERGGKLTYHGPGQLVGYPIMRITDVVDYLRTLEQALIASLADVDVGAQIREGLTGVWVEDRKIGSIGIHVSRGVTMHGFAINVNNDLAPFDWVTACGIEGVQMTSIKQETGRIDLMDTFVNQVIDRFAEQFHRQVCFGDCTELAVITNAVKIDRVRNVASK
jgi:lipoyl(octanoyl) transferase